MHSLADNDGMSRTQILNLKVKVQKRTSGSPKLSHKKHDSNAVQTAHRSFKSAAKQIDSVWIQLVDNVQ